MGFQMPADASGYAQPGLLGPQQSIGQTGCVATHVGTSMDASVQMYTSSSVAMVEIPAMCDTGHTCSEVVPRVYNCHNYSDLWGMVWKLSKEKEGCKRVQDMIKDAKVHREVKSALLSELRNHVGAAWKHPWANFVLTCALEYLPPSDTQFILDEMLPHVSKAAKDRCGVRVVEKILEFGEPEKAKSFVELLFAHATTLCKGEYGVYAVLHLMEHAPGGSSEAELNVQKRRLLNIVQENLTDLAKDTWAPIVVMKVLTNCCPETRDALLRALLSDAGLLASMASEPKRGFGLEAAKEALELAKDEDKLAAVEKLEELSDFLVKRGRFGKKFIEFVKDLKKEFVSNDGQK